MNTVKPTLSKKTSNRSLRKNYQKKGSTYQREAFLNKSVSISIQEQK